MKLPEFGEIGFEWLGVTPKIPHWTCVRSWLMRGGVSRRSKNLSSRRTTGSGWLADHSNQIGQEKVLGDFKHFAANVLKKLVGKKLVGKEERFVEFLSQVGRTRSSAQQTELAHLTPPGSRPKARFMNLAATLKWASMVLWHLSHPHSVTRRGITTERMNEKLGWLRGFRSDIERWLASQRVISTTLTFINRQALFRDAAEALTKELLPLRTCELSRLVADRLIDFVRSAEVQLSPGERLPLSTEIPESSFGLYKQLKGQHSKGGFTSLLASFGT